MSRSLDDLFDDSSDPVSPCDVVKNVMMDLHKIGDLPMHLSMLSPRGGDPGHVWGI